MEYLKYLIIFALCSAVVFAAETKEDGKYLATFHVGSGITANYSNVRVSSVAGEQGIGNYSPDDHDVKIGVLYLFFANNSITPEEEAETGGGGDDWEFSSDTYCGDGFCVIPENFTSCSPDCREYIIASVVKSLYQSESYIIPILFYDYMSYLYDPGTTIITLTENAGFVLSSLERHSIGNYTLNISVRNSTNPAAYALTIKTDIYEKSYNFTVLEKSQSKLTEILKAIPLTIRSAFSTSTDFIMTYNLPFIIGGTLVIIIIVIMLLFKDHIRLMKKK